MQSNNPVFNNSKAFKDGGYATFNEAPPATAGQLEEMYSAPAATGVETGRMTIDDVVVKTGLMFAVLLPLRPPATTALNNPVLTFGGVIAGLVLGLVVSFKQSTNAGADPGLRRGRGPVPRRHQPGVRGPVATASSPQAVARHPARLRGRPGRLQERPGAGDAEVPAHRADRDGWLPGLLPGQPRRDAVRRRRRLRPALRVPFGFAIGLFAVGLAAALLILDFDFAEQGVQERPPGALLPGSRRSASWSRWSGSTSRCCA